MTIHHESCIRQWELVYSLVTVLIAEYPRFIAKIVINESVIFAINRQLLALMVVKWVLAELPYILCEESDNVNSLWPGDAIEHNGS